MNLLSRLRPHVLPVILLVLSVAAGFLNYTPGTLLSGWDTLHPEFNFGLYLQRIFWGAWQEHQGLGAVAVQAHASELGRLWYLLPAHFLLPVDLFRYGYFWLMLIAGPLGIFYLLRRVVRPEAAFLGGLFYLLNLGTLQYFYLPLEMFATAYGFLPWLFLAVYQRRIRLLALLFFVSAPMAHTPTLWFINFAALVSFAFFLNKKWAMTVAVTGLAVNSFWILPSLYFLVGHGAEVALSKISQQFSSRAVLTSREFATLPDVALIRGYLFDWGHFDFARRQFVDLFAPWKEHFKDGGPLLIGYGSFVAAVAGLFLSFRRRIDLGRAMLPVLVLGALGLLIVLDFEVLRFPFTKFSLFLMVSLAVYFGLAAEHFKRFWFLTVAALVFYMWPAFKGDLICPCMRVVIPAEYGDVFKWFAGQDKNTRVAPFPTDSLFGWQYYSWGYEGAGFRWFGLPQPILDREFDRWMPTNENYYWEISYALYSKNLALFEDVLEKYRVSWLLLDESVINPASPKALYNEEFQELVGQSKKINLVRTFGPTSLGLRGVNKIKIYEVRLERPTKDFVSVVRGLPEANQYKWGSLDQAFRELGDYVATKKSAFKADVSGSAISSRKSGSTPDRIVTQNNQLSSWGWSAGESSPSDLGAEPDPEPFAPHPATSITYQFRSLFTGRRQEDLEFDARTLVGGEAQIINQNVKNCTQTDQGQVGKTTSCADFFLPQLPHNQGYLITVESQNFSGMPLLFWIENLNNLNSRRADLETYLPKKQDPSVSSGLSYYIQPPMEADGLGYTLHFDNVSIGKEKTVNQLGKVVIEPIDYWNLVSRKQGGGAGQTARYLGAENFAVEHPNPAFYRVDLVSGNVPKDTTLILSQSFEPGWVGLAVGDGGKIEGLQEHVKINNWANGWKLAGDERIVYLIFWPQLLEFAGFGLLGVMTVVLVASYFRERRKERPAVQV